RGAIERNLQEAIAVVSLSLEPLRRHRDAIVGIERAIAGFEVEISLRINRGNATALPDAAQAAVGRGVERAGNGERGLVKPEQPAVIRPIVAVTTEREVDVAV